MGDSLKKAVIYHGGGCYDGFTAAWVAHKVWPDADFYPMLHSDTLPDLTGREVVLLDITFSLPVMERLCQMASAVMVIDHHFTSKAVLDVLGDRVWAHLDMERSGAGLAWDVLMGTPRPWLVKYVEDRDLSRFQYGEKTHLYHAALTAHPQTFEVWETFARRLPRETIDHGKPIRAARLKLAHELCEKATVIEIIESLPIAVWCVNAPLSLTFEVNEILAERPTPWAGIRLPVLSWHWDGPRGVNYYSLRSWEGGPDVERIARSFGGGGHKTAAGFTHEFDPENLLAESGR
jgi:hypothetical protein